MTTSNHVRTCPLCEASCGLSVDVTNGHVTRIRGDRDDVLSKGFLCAKGSVLHHLHEDPDRLRQPVVRDGDSWREVTWDEAFARVEELLTPLRQDHGNNAMAVYIGNPNVHGPVLLSLQTLMAAAGTTNLFTAGTVDQLGREVANGFLYGDPRAWGVPDLDRTDLLVILGANPVVSGGSLCTAPGWPDRIDAIRARGGKVIVIDPRRTETADRSDEWLAIRPGSDAHLLAGIAHVLFRDQLVDLASAASYTDGLHEIAALVTNHTPERVSTRTGIDADRIISLAHQLAATARSVVYGRVGLQTNAFGTMASWLTDVVNILSGSFDLPGGMMFCHPAVDPVTPPYSDNGFVTGRWRSRLKGYAEARGELPLATLPDEILTTGDGQIRALICLAGNPVLSGPDGVRMDEAMATLDALISVDMYRNETNRHAHVILPPPSQLQRTHYDLFFYPMAVRNVANYSPELFTPTGLREEDIHARLAAILVGLGAACPASLMHDGLIDVLIASEAGGIDAALVKDCLDGETAYDKAIDLFLRTGPYGAGFPGHPGLGADRPDGGLTLALLIANPHGVDLGALQPAFPERLRTLDSRLNIAPPAIAADVPRLVADLDETPAGLVLIGRRQVRSNNSWMHNLRILTKGAPRCTLLVHPSDAAAYGLVDGHPATVTSRVGTLTATVAVDHAMSPGVVSLPHGWGHANHSGAIAQATLGENSNLLTDPDALDPLSGTCAINGIPVTVAASTR